MKLKNFSAKNVYGYLDFEINFNDDINFLVGGNGSGKTSALKLINALIKPDIRYLLLTPFDMCSLKLSYGFRNRNEITITSYKEGKQIYLETDRTSSRLQLLYLNENEKEYYVRRPEKLVDELIQFINSNYEHEVLSEISGIRSPIFLGLDRKNESLNLRSRYIAKEIDLEDDADVIRTKRVTQRNYSGINLSEIELLVQARYRKFRRIEESKSVELRDQILLSTFSYTHHSEISKEYFLEKNNLIKREKEIKDTISNIVDYDEHIVNELDNFFEKINQLMATLDYHSKNINVEWLLNKAQIDRMSHIVEIIDRHKSSVDSYYEPIKKFLDTINDFYHDSKKELTIDTVGQMIVKNPNKTETSIEGLSSGERQLLVIFANSFFAKRTSNEVLIIDEPELSLHLRWQEMFMEKILESNPNCQLIFATHSPEIIAGRKEKAIGCK